MVARTLPALPRVIHHYRLGPALGAGGMGVVHRAVDERDGTVVALKILYPDLAADARFLKRFEREAEVIALLTSPYVARLLAFGQAEGLYVMALEFVEGDSVGQVLAGGRVDAGTTLRVGRQVALALEEAHSKGVIHRDIKPDNIILRPDRNVRLLDFGIARVAEGEALTRVGEFIGTSAYCAPEQMAGRPEAASDVYALGATLYHMLAGKPPWGDSFKAVVEARLAGELSVEPLAGTPGNVVDIVVRCLRGDPAERYSAGELAARLAEV
ncbi:MAG: serine/threonine-protein kinase [Dehalococcoidia bacterium]